MSRMNTITFLSILVFVLMASTAEGKIIYVDDDANGLNDGSSWADAYNYLQDALASATDGDEIHVAQGIYKPDRGVGFTPGDKSANFYLKNGVAIRGGFAGFGEPDPNSRDIERYKTTLSGDLAGNDIDVNNPNDPQYRILYNDNSYALVTGSGTDYSATFDGFTVYGSSVYLYTDRIGPGGETRPPDPHGGIFNWAGSPTVINCTFTGNFSPGMYNSNGSSPTLVNCTFEKNSGGGIENYKSNPDLIDCKFIEHSSSWAEDAAIYNSGSDPNLTRCIFSDNLVGAMYNNYESRPTLAECIFTRNSTAIYNEDGSPTLADCVFKENAKAIYSKGGQLNIRGCVFLRNYRGAITDYSETGSVFTNCIFSGNSPGGAVYASNVTFTRCLFAGNRALGGYIHNEDTWYYGMGGAVYITRVFNQISVFNNCTFINNWADFGCAIYCFGWVNLTNCIFWGFEDQIQVYPYSPPTVVRYSDVQGGWQGEGNIDIDPCFVDPGRWVNANDPNQIAEPSDPNAVWIDGDYHLKSQAGRWDPVSESWVQDDVTSPCIDAGDPNSPVAFEPFPNGGIVNMGAYGGTAEASKSYFGEPVCETIVAGDINGDCKVDFKDFSIMASHWLEQQ
jgi:hypothetical protein